MEEYQRVVPGFRPGARAGYIGLRRNALLALGAVAQQNTGLVEWATRPEEDPRVREAAIWARDQIRAGAGSSAARDHGSLGYRDSSLKR